MQKIGIYHRPESEDVQLRTADTVKLRLRTARDDMTAVTLIYDDPYLLNETHPGQQAPLVKVGHDDLFDYWEVTVQQVTKRLAYAFVLVDSDGTTALYGDQRFYDQVAAVQYDGGKFFKLPYFHVVDTNQAPAWVKETVWYQIFPERFANGDVTNDPTGTLSWDTALSPQVDSFYGGDLAGIIAHLDYLADLGINGLYLTPIFKAPSNHKYDTVNYLAVDDMFGDEVALRTLVTAAHERGMRIMLDAVFNHIGDQSAIWQDVVINGRASKYADWFHINDFPVGTADITEAEFMANRPYDTFAFTPHMPKWDTSIPAVQDYLINVGRYWLENFDIDAWRLDVANEVDHQFWRRFKTAMRAIKPDVYILGEVWHTAQPWLDGTQFDGVMNYAFMQHIKDFFLTRQMAPAELANHLMHELMLYDDDTNQMMFNLLDSHDTARIKTIANNNESVVQQLLAFMMMQPGTPDIYYGTEVGMVGGDDPDNRRPMDWQLVTADNAMLRFTKQLIHVRREWAAVLAAGTYQFETTADSITVIRQDQQTTITAIFTLDDAIKVVVPATATILLGQLGDQMTLAATSVLIYQQSNH